MNDTQAPIIVCPGNQTVTANNSGCTYLQNGISFDPVVTDNCPNPNKSYSLSGATSGTGSTLSGQLFNLGNTTVSWVVTDGSANTSSCSFTVTVQNNIGASIAGTATAVQNPATNSTITFTGSGSGAAPGTQQYSFTYRINGGAQQFGNTAIGSNSISVLQTNASLGTFVYTLDAVTDLTTGCTGQPPTFVAGSTATINIVAAGTIDLTTSVDLSSSQVNPGNFIEYIIVVRNIGQLPTNGSAINVNVTPFTGGLGGLTQSQVAGAVTVNGTPYTPTAGWAYNAATGDLTTTNVIQPGGANANIIRLRITRAAIPNQGAPGTINSTVTIAGGSGGEQPAQNSNNSQNTSITKPN